MHNNITIFIIGFFLEKNCLHFYCITVANKYIVYQNSDQCVLCEAIRDTSSTNYNLVITALLNDNSSVFYALNQKNTITDSMIQLSQWCEDKFILFLQYKRLLPPNFLKPWQILCRQIVIITSYVSFSPGDWKDRQLSIITPSLEKGGGN